jgi:hypothetical protein
VAVARLHLNDRRVRLWIWLIGLGVVWVGYRAHSTPLIVVGVVLASAGYWTRLAPGSRYRNRVSAIINDWQRALGAAGETLQRDRDQRRELFAELPVPPACAEGHRRLLALVSGRSEQAGDSTPDRRAPDRSAPDRSEQAIGNYWAVRDELASLRAAAETEEERVYVEHATRLQSDFTDGHVHYAGELERCLSEAIARLESLRVPARLGDAHRTLSGSLRSEFIGVNAYNRAVQELDLDAAHAAVEQLHRERAVTAAAIAQIYGTGGSQA